MLQFALMCGREMVKTFCTTSTHSNIHLLACLAKTKGPDGRTFIENFSGFISHRKDNLPVESPDPSNNRKQRKMINSEENVPNTRVGKHRSHSQALIKYPP